MMKFRRKIAMIMAVLMGSTTIITPQNVYANNNDYVIECNADNEAAEVDEFDEGATTPPTVNEAQVTARIMELARILGVNEGNLNTGWGIQFTANMGACPSGHPTNDASSSNCTNCKNTYVVQSAWFKERFGYNMSGSLLPRYYNSDGSKWSNVGWTCWGFASFALWYVAKENITDDVCAELVGDANVPFTYDNLVKYGVRIGDLIRYNGHSVMFLGFEGTNKIKVLDANYVNYVVADIASVRIHTVSLNSSYRMAISRATNYKPDSAAADTTLPIISDVKIVVDGTGYTVSCTAVDNVGVTKVAFPTWTDYNGQDDLAPEYWNTELGIRNGNTFTYRVNIADHNMEYGNYFTHIYAYDAAGNYSMYPVSAYVIEETPIEKFVGRMYTVALNRTADAAGKANWVTMLNVGTHDGAAIAGEFILGQEFAMRNLTNDAYVDVLYNTFFDRSADVTGKTNWLNYLVAGYSRGFVLSEFVNSQEFTMLCQSYGIERGVMYNGGATANVGVTKFVNRLYLTVLGRGADSAGYTNWTVALVTKQQNAEQVAKSFFTSQEYLNKDTNNTTFVTDLYRTFFDREPDATGLANWKNLLNSGATRATVIAEFARSEEFKALAAGYGLN